MERETVEWKKWIEFGRSGGEEALTGPLENQRRIVVDLWQKFCHLYPSKDQGLVELNNVPTIGTLLKEVHQAEAAWQSKQNKGFNVVKNRFLNFAETMNDYSYLFSIVPNGDKYTSLITGVVSSVVKVSVHHKTTAEGFAEALSDVSDCLRSVEKSTQIADSEDMRKLVVDLYIEVFGLLCHSLQWFMKKRKRWSSALKLDTTVPMFQKKIEKIVLRINNEKIQVALDQLRLVGNQNRRDETAEIHDKLDKMGEQLGHLAARTLNSVEQRQRRDLDIAGKKFLQIEGPTQGSSAEDPESGEEEPDDATGSEEEYSRYDMEKYLARISDYTDDARSFISNPLRGSSPLLLPEEVMHPMVRWIKTKESKMIWVQGVSGLPVGSGLSRAALQIYNVSLQGGIPCVSYFCKPRYDFSARKQLSSKEAGMVSLLYSVVSQLTCLLPMGFPATKGLDESHFSLLDGSAESLPAALELIQALLIHTPPSLVWVIDGLQLLQDEATVPHMRAFVEILRDQETKRISKVCFTTDGNCLVLARATNVRERVDATRMAQSRPGAVMRGGSSVWQLR
ncbi:hypothetical protein F5X68DRAFT_276978 [Plectosphaerella plurivora]|uniref:DUF7708 domain-containing protein n=1 Tax=Plectosphaerella plurivora TaxID=936078 RepID=A0A9P8V8X7_9PEZI|nr:hypothetical protein F5X68DRAFT_276978 [Plectosphaerella plurivora]